jgi:hypothetical protein
MSQSSADEIKGQQLYHWLAVVFLLAFLVFVLGFTFSHGLCCGDDSDLALKAKELLGGDFRSIYAGFDPHAGVVIPIALMVKVVGNTYWAPGMAVLALDFILLILAGYFLRTYYTNPGFAMTAGTFFALNYILMSQHFEQWYAALGEVPAGLMILSAALAYTYKNRISNHLLAGSFLLLAILTKFTTILALFGFITTLIIYTFFALYSKEKQLAKSYFHQAVLLGMGLLVPFLVFEVVHIAQVGFKKNINRLLNTFNYSLDYIQRYSVSEMVPETLSKSSIFSDRFGIPFLLFLILIGLAGYLIRKKPRLIKIYYLLIAVIIPYSIWWFYFSIGWGRHYIIPLLLGIFLITLPLLVLDKSSQRWLYLGGILLVSSFAWSNLDYPLNQLDGNYFHPTAATETLLTVPELLREVTEDDLVITKRHGTFEAIQYITDKELNIHYFNSTVQYQPPLWVAIRTDWVAVNDDFLSYANKNNFKQFMSRCKGLQSVNSYLIGTCH